MELNKIIEECIYPIIDEMAADVESPDFIKSPSTILFGENATLDSIGLVTLIVAVEENVSDKFNTELSLLTDKAFSQNHSPFRTVSTLAEYIKLELESV